MELIDDLKERGINFSHCLIDAWYGNSPDFICRSADQWKNRKGVEYRNHLYITPLYANHRIFCRLCDDIDSVEHNVKELVTSIKMLSAEQTTSKQTEKYA